MHTFKYRPRTRQRVSTILSAFASVRMVLESKKELPFLVSESPNDRFVISVNVPIPSPAASPPNVTRRLILVAGTFLCLEVAESCWNLKYRTTTESQVH